MNLPLRKGEGIKPQGSTVIPSGTPSIGYVATTMPPPTLGRGDRLREIQGILKVNCAADRGSGKKGK